MCRFLFFLSLFISLLQAEDIENLFKKYSIKGTLLIENLAETKAYSYNPTRAKVPYSPASTFKIPHTLIALNEEVITTDTIFKWDKKNRDYEIWNKNQTLESAFKNSCVWCYQEIAKKIDKVVYENYLTIFDYGNARIRRDIQNFWLDGALRISSYEQLKFMQRFYNYDIAIKREHIFATKKLLLQKETSEYKLSYKTGWDGKVGWIVGYVQGKNDTYFFVLNAHMSENELYLREKIVLEVLSLKGVIKEDI